jgi:regulatory protein
MARARQICLTQLGRSARTRAQLAEALRRRGIPDDIVERVLDRFTEIQLIDDAGYAEMFVRSRHRDRGLARRALAYELRRRGVDADVAGEALEVVDDDDEAATARRLVAAKLPATRGLDPQRRLRRLVGMLARKGYGPGVALAAVKDALAEEDDATVRLAEEAGDSWIEGTTDIDDALRGFDPDTDADDF